MPPLASLGPRLVRPESGQASVELVATVPFVVIAAAIAWQLALTGQTAWLCANAARVAARAEAVGRDARNAARSALPARLRRDLDVSHGRGRAVRVSVRVPLLFSRLSTPLRLSASAHLPRGGP